MSPKTIARVIAAPFFVFWLAILYAGADHPPPPRFFVLVVFDLLATLAIRIRVPVYLGWRGARRRRLFLRVLLEGLAAGFALAALTALLPGTGEPSVASPGAADRVIWFAVIGVVGALNSALVYGGAILLGRWRRAGAAR